MFEFLEKFWNFDKKIVKLAEKINADCTEKFVEIEQISAYNNAKVLSAFIKNKVSAQSLIGSTGYGYGDFGKDTIDSVFATIFGCKDALVRHNFVSGTHAISTVLFGLLRPGDSVVSVTGKPYDTLYNIIGDNEIDGSLKNFGIDWFNYDVVDKNNIKFYNRLKNAKIAYIQRSKGYSLRPAYTVFEIEKIIQNVKNINENIIIVVDNCYGEFVQNIEPTEVGADIVVGSLIKNPGGGIARTGGYICGKSDLITKCANRLTVIGMGKEIGCTLDTNREILLGVYNSPNVVANARKIGLFTAKLFAELGYETFPKFDEQTGDIVVAIKFGHKELLVTFCQGIQACSPIDSYVTPIPWAMPGYNCDVIMAAGAFTNGSSIELSADAPLREPYAVWLQGGTNYTNGIIGVLNATNILLQKGFIKI
ncbi:hypothetical protein FACS1894132_07370 [Clostridia bacterium]|nr:hypothetical protein FACS1894132_07370 [Clostridia bacterium]